MSVSPQIVRRVARGVLVMSLWTLGCTVAVTQEPDDDVREGRALYDSHQCWQCHGYEGQGSVAGVRIAPTLYPYEAFSRLVRHTNLMPAYSPNVLSEEQLRLIYAFVQSIPEPPPLEDIPELDFEQ